MDDFKMVLGMDFLQKVKVVPVPFLGSMAILEEEKSCMVPTITEGSPKTLMLSAMQVKKGLKRKEVTYLATLKEEQDDGSGEPMPKEIKGVLDEFKDVMPPKLPKRLPPRRKEDHKIELEPGVKPLTMGPYKMGEILHEARLEVGLLPSKDYGGDKSKTTSVTRYGSYEFLVMPFDLTNAQRRACRASKEGLQDPKAERVIRYFARAAPLTNLLKKRHGSGMEGSHFIVKTDNVATSYFQTQKKLSPKQARWQDFLAEFDYTLKYNLGSANHVADALSRKAELASMTSQPQEDIMDLLRKGLQHYLVAKSLIVLAHEGKTKWFWVEDGLLYTKGRRLYMPKWGNIRRNLIKECHDTKWVGHPGATTHEGTT
ncbi:hypothetical protein CK203_043645 [Vitis vinifera]|uniref:Reverse transcriptase RNase H-like domain-containing protein n=1 Tax=Vitis vinifera TaxID=29760 RepID=A0A438HYJ7_VITVI|nr:hypothetical protein CK203_043645 [Vitis vinifera]